MEQKHENKKNVILNQGHYLWAAAQPGNQIRTTHAFTLIELLIVVLIIGILTAVAVPQYKKAMIKAHMAEYEINLKAIQDAQDICTLQKGSQCSWEELDIEQPKCKPIPGIFDACRYDADAVVTRVYTSNPWLFYKKAHSGKVGNKEYQIAEGIQCHIWYILPETCKKLGLPYRNPITGHYIKTPPVLITE